MVTPEGAKPPQISPPQLQNSGTPQKYVYVKKWGTPIPYSIKSLSCNNNHHLWIRKIKFYKNFWRGFFSSYFCLTEGLLMKLYWKIQRGILLDIKNDPVTLCEEGWHFAAPWPPLFPTFIWDITCYTYTTGNTTILRSIGQLCFCMTLAKFLVKVLG